jgi:tryptophan synthase alpha chain
MTAGYPDMNSTEEIFTTIENAGADIIEMGIPFSDPIADGSTIQFSSDKALSKGANLDRILASVRRIREKSETPIIFMSYLNPLMRGGFENTVQKAKSAGVDGFIIPDMIPEESAELEKTAKKHGLSLIFLAAPNSDSKRLAYIDKASNPFVYIVSLTGVTGSRKTLPASLKTFLELTSKKMRKPRFLGFGISDVNQVRSLKKYIDGIIVGSALIEIIRKNKSSAARRSKLASFVASLKKSLN